MSEHTVGYRIYVEVDPWAADDAERPPIRLVIAAGADIRKQWSMTPHRAQDVASSLAGMLAGLMTPADADRLAQGLRTAAARVWEVRN